MSSLTTCIKKAGAHLRAEDKAAILAASRKYRKEGLSASEAGIRAVQDQIAAVRGIISGASPAPTAERAPEPVRTFKTRKAAEAERDALGNEHKLQRIKDGFILRRKSDKEMAAEARNGRRLAAGASGKRSLLTVIAAGGGLNIKDRADSIGEGNRNVGGKMLFTREGKSIHQWAEQLHEGGWMPVEESESVAWLMRAIGDEFAGRATHYQLSDTEKLEAQVDAARGEEPDPLEPFGVDELDEAGYAGASPEVQAATEAILADAEASGLDTEAIREDAARATEGKTDAEYHAEVQRAAAEAIARHREDAGRDVPEGPGAGGEDRGQAAGDQGQEGLTLEAQDADSLRAKTEREEAGRKAEAAEQKRLEDKAKADARRGEFTLTGSDRAADVGVAQGQGDIFAEPVSPTAERRAPSETATPGGTDDVGENLKYNRRNVSRGGIGWNDVENLSDALKVREVVKAKVWPKPDYAALIDAGMPPMVARAVKQVYDAIGSGPTATTDEALKLYIDTLAKVRAQIDVWADDAAVTAALTSGDVGYGTAARASKLLEMLWPNNANAPRYARWGASTQEGQEARALGGNKFLKAIQFDRSDLTKWAKDVEGGWPASKEAWERQGYSVRAKSDALTIEEVGQYGAQQRETRWVLRSINRYLSSHATLAEAEAARDAIKYPWLVLDKSGRIVGGADSQAEAKDAARGIVKRESSSTGGSADSGFALGDAQRVGVARREAGENVSAQRLMDDFGFRGINFGRKGYIGDELRQAYLNAAWDALHDLAELTGLPAKALSLNGELGLAFGAQGRGGRAAAHFVPGMNEINLTRDAGAGTLAHEWGHALDHYFAARAGLAREADPFLSDHAAAGDTRPKFDGPRKVGTEPRFAADLRPEVLSAFKALHDAMNRRPVTQDMAKLRMASSRAKAVAGLDKWIAHMRKAMKSTDAQSEFDALADKLRAGDLGDGYVRIGRMSPLRKTVGDMALLVRSKGDRAAGIDLPSNWKGLDASASHVAYVVKSVEAQAEHVPQGETTSSTYASESASADGAKKGKKYWSTEHEKFARAFETWVSDRLKAREQANTFLSTGGGRADDTSEHRMPYPRGDEREAMARAFDTLVNELKTRTDDAGNVALYSRTGTDTDEARALKALSENDELFDYPRGEGQTVEEVAASIDPGNKAGELHPSGYYTGPTTRESLRQHLADEIGADTVAALEQAGLLTISDRPAGNMPADVAGVTQGWRIGLYAANTAPGSVAVAYHEALHATLRQTIGDEAFDALMARMPALVAANRAFFSDARIPANTPAAAINSERASYGVEAYQSNRETMPKSVLRWVEDLIAALKAGLAKALQAAGVGLQIRVRLLSDAKVLRVIARDGLKGMAREAMASRENLAPAFSRGKIDNPTGEDYGDGFWKRIRRDRQGDLGLAAARVAQSLLGRTGRRSGEFAGNQPARAATGLEPIRFKDRIAGWDDFVSIAIAVGDGDSRGIRLYVIPTDLMNSAPDAERNKMDWAERNAVLIYDLRGSEQAGVELSVSSSGPGYAAFEAAPAGSFLPTGKYDVQGREYYRVPLGLAASKDYLSEAVRRFALHYRFVPKIKYARETGASVRAETRTVSPESVEERYSKVPQTDTAAFKAWFGDSVVTENGKAGGVPLVVYHGTDKDFAAFDPDAEPETYSSDRGKQFFTTSRTTASEYAANGMWGEKKTGANVMPVYLSMQNPLMHHIDGNPSEEWDRAGEAIWQTVEARGNDGAIIVSDDTGERLFVTSKPTQIKSAIGNSGAFDTANPDIRYSIADSILNFGAGTRITGQTTRQYTPEQLASMRNVGFQTDTPSIEARIKALWKDAGKKLAQGLVDQFAPVKELSKDAYALMRLSKGASGAFETLLQGGRLKLDSGVYDFDEQHRGGVIDTLLKPLQGEHHDFFRWVAANRAERLVSEGKENLFSDDDIDNLKSLADGVAPFDYTIQHGAQAGTVTRDRTLIYADSLKTFNEFNKNVLDMAEQSGLIDGASRAIWEHDFYVPFYRVSPEEDGGVRGMNVKSGVVRQEAFKALKGGRDALNTDLLDNTLMNWAHLLDASAKNRGAKATLEAAENMGVALSSTESAAREMAAAMGKRGNVVWVMDGGEKHFYVVEDPYLMTALTALEFAGMRGPMMDAMGFFKRVLTIGVTASPFFKVRNLVRDSLQAIAAGPLGYNPAANVAQGWKLTNPKSDAYFKLLAGGGTIHFGTMMEGNEAKRVQALVESGVDRATILGSDKKVKAFYRKYIEPGITAYNELGNRGEAINRASLYAQLRSQGMSHADASLQARDLMDFSMQGSFTSIRFLTQVVPFFNARIQGLYKLGRAAKEDPARFSAVLGATALASLALLAAFSDDEDWKKREDWDRNNFWWFKFGGVAFRIPKPFEIGAIATLAERGFELAFEKEMTEQRFRQNVMQLLGDNLSMNPVPQLIKPVLDVYANKDSFTGRPIETMGMDRLRPDYRFTDRTSMAARGISTAANSVSNLVGANAPSPVQVDHLLRGYFGWLGSFVVAAGDLLARPATGQPTRPESDLFKVVTGNMVSDLRDAPSRYVSQMYQQAREIEQAYGTWKALVKEGKAGEAKEFREDNLDLLSRYRVIERAKSAETKLNQMIRQIEQGDASALEKRVRIRAINAQKEAIAKRAEAVN